MVMSLRSKWAAGKAVRAGLEVEGAYLNRYVLTGCSTADRTVGHNHTGGYAQIAPRAYDSEGRSFDRPWPFGPESTKQ
jgi:hypothetical protein